MLAKAATGLPVGDYFYEPKWDGFRCIVFREGDRVELASRNERPLTRYFPELWEPLLATLPERCVLDGEIVVVGSNGLDFEALGQRIHPAASRIARLSNETPARFVAFDIIALDTTDLRSTPFADRRALLEVALRDALPPVHITPITRDPDLAADWFDRFEGAGFDGLIAKDAASTYQCDVRAMAKVKHRRTADVVVAGYRPHKDGAGVGSLLVGLHDNEGRLHNVGVTTSFTAAFRSELVDLLAPYEADAMTDHPWAQWASEAEDGTTMPGGKSRWNNGKDLTWVPLRCELVIEVAYEGLLGPRFRHQSRFVRWRPDKGPGECTYDQLEAVAPAELEALLAQNPVGED
jgi:ATP-dependent DNA ligase